jgi:hypothetical protein
MKTGLSAVLLSTMFLLLLTVASSSALGAEFESTGGYPVNFSNINATEHSFNLNSTDKVVCEGAFLKGQLTAKSPKLVLTPEYTGCRYYESPTSYKTATISNKCSYEFTITGGSGPYSGKMKIINSGCQILITSGTCELYFEPQGPNANVKYEVSGSEMKWTLEVSSLKYTVAHACPGIAVGSYGTGEYAAKFRDKEIIIH